MKRILICLMFVLLIFDGYAIENNELLEKYNLKMDVHAWNDYMPPIAMGRPRPHFVVRFTAISKNTKVPNNISVSAKITSVKRTIDVKLDADNGLETFRPKAEDRQLLQMETGEKLTAVVTFVIGNEKQTLTFYPIVEATH